MRHALFSALLVAACAPRPAPAPAAPSRPFAQPPPPAAPSAPLPAQSAPPPVASAPPPAADAGSVPQPAPAEPVAVRSGNGTPPWMTSPPSVSCPKPLRAELDRLLAAASAHASESSGCIDGPGVKTKLTLLRVDAASSKGVRWVRIRYGAMSEEVRGGAECSGPPCAPPEPRWGIAEISIRFAPVAGGYEMTVPEKWPAIELTFSQMTPLDREHDGKCYGKSPPFSPAVVKGW